MTWRATILTLFPDMFPGPLGVSLAGKALASGLWALEARDIRASATDSHRSVDDTPAGGGPGMVLRADVLAAAIDAADTGQSGRAAPPDEPPRSAIDPVPGDRNSPAGPGPLIVCGRFEGIDERVIEARGLEEVSIGDYVLSGGEVAAMALIDACVRLLPGVMGRQASGTEESFSEGLLEYPQYTRPQEFEGRTIPEILISGDHAKVAAWRQAEAEALTRARRPDLWAQSKGPPKTPKKHDRRVTSAPRCLIRAPNPQQRQDRWTFAQPALDWLGAPPMEISMNIIQAARKRAVRQTRRDQVDPRVRPGRHRDRQRQGGRRRAHPRAGL